MIYLDNAATTKMHPQVLSAMMPYLTEQYGNAGTMYSLGRAAAAAIEEARSKVAKFLNAEPSQIFFTSGGTEGNSMVFHLAKQYMKKTGRTIAAVSNIEHKSVIRSAEQMCDESGFVLQLIPATQNGVASYSFIADEMRESFGIVSVMYANNELGTVNTELPQIAKLCHENGALFHTDCVQAAGCQKIDVKEIDCDFATISSHKIHGPKGVGAIYIKDPEQFQGMILGGEDQESGLRGGTENVPGIVGFGKACELAMNVEAAASFFSSLNSIFRTSLYHFLSEYGLKESVHINGCVPESRTNCKTVSYMADGVDAETLVLLASQKGVCISAGSACNSRENVPSHVLKAIGLTDTQARSSFRVSVSSMNSFDEMWDAGKIIAECIASLREM